MDKRILAFAVTAVLVTSMFAGPYNIGNAYGHESGWHAKCWELAFRLVPKLLEIFRDVITNFLIGLSAITFGASLAGVPPNEFAFWVADGIAIPLTPIASYACPPEIIPPPVTVQGQASFECNSFVGFTFTSREHELKNKLTGNSIGEIIPIVRNDETGIETSFPSVVVAFAIVDHALNV